MVGENNTPDNGNVNNDSGSSAPLTQPASQPGSDAGVQAPPVKPAPVTPAPRSGFDRIFHGVSDMLGGKYDLHYSVDPNTGKTITTKTPRTPGQQWAHVVGAALAGLSQANSKPTDAIESLGRGAEAAQQKVQADDTRHRAQAQQQFKNEGEAQQRKNQADELTMAKARDAREQQESVLKAQEYQNRFRKFDYDFTQEQEHDRQEIVDRWNNRQQAGVKPLMVNGKETPEFDTLAQANEFAMAHRKEVIAGFTSRIDVDPQTHKFVLGLVPQEKQMYTVTLPDGTKGTLYGTANDMLNYANKQAEIRRDNKQIEEANLRITSMKIDVGEQQKMQGAQDSWRKSLQAAGNDPEKAVDYMQKNYPDQAAFLQQHELDILATKGGVPIFSGGFGEQKDPFGEKLPLKSHADFTKESAAFQKEYVLPAVQVEKSYQMSESAYREFMAARAQGKQLPTGAQSMLMLSNHLSTTFGQVKGARVTKDMIEHHLGARGVSDAAEAAINKLINGDTLSYEQWKAFHELISESRHQTWALVADQAKNQGLPRNFMPRGNGKFIDDDPDTAKLFFEVAGGDVGKATAAAAQFGWKIKPSGTN